MAAHCLSSALPRDEESEQTPMDIYEAFQATQQFAASLPAVFGEVRVALTFGPGRPCIGDWDESANLGMLIRDDGIGCRSGLYFFTSSAGQIVYIGKATKKNLHHRVWGHLKTPGPYIATRRTYPNHSFGTRRQAQTAISQIADGSARLAVMEVSEPSLVSLVEVFLQTLHLRRYNALPMLNRQIG